MEVNLTQQILRCIEKIVGKDHFELFYWFYVRRIEKK